LTRISVTPSRKRSASALPSPTISPSASNSRCLWAWMLWATSPTISTLAGPSGFTSWMNQAGLLIAAVWARSTTIPRKRVRGLRNASARRKLSLHNQRKPPHAVRLSLPPRFTGHLPPPPRESVGEGLRPSRFLIRRSRWVNLKSCPPRPARINARLRANL